MKKFKFIYDLLPGLKRYLFGIVIVNVIFVAMSLLSPLLVSFLKDNVIDLQPITNPVLANIGALLGGVAYIRENLWLTAALVVGVSVISCIVVFFRGRWNSKVAERLVERLRNKVFQHLLLLPYSYHVKAKTGDLIQRCTSDVDQIRRVFAGQLSELVYSLTIASIAIPMLFSLHSQLALISIMCMPIIIIFAFIFFGLMQKAFLASDVAEGAMSDTIQENLSAIRVVKAFNRESYELAQFQKKNDVFYKDTFHMIELLGIYWGVSDFICLTQILIVVLFGISYTSMGALSVGNLFVFISYESVILWPIRNIGRIISDLGKVSVSIGRLQEITDVPIEDVVSGATPDLNGDIVFDHVSFQYDDGDSEVLRDVSFTIHKGETVAIMGPTGSGKSSLVHLLTRLYDQTKGVITINGNDLLQIQKHHLRKNVGIVLQEPFLFSKTILENIRLSNPEMDKERVMDAARIASVNHVIEEFERGYDTLVGEKGVTLSGGQKQRIAIARTVINEAPILIFDDSLSAVDTQTDAEIREAIQNLSKDITTLIITQRVSSSEHADKILVLEEGHITQQGTHAQLLNEEGLYQKVYEIQSNMTWEVGDENE
jgi:ABC-type multidrug transport system, ATPase and permease components